MDNIQSFKTLGAAWESYKVDVLKGFDDMPDGTIKNTMLDMLKKTFYAGSASTMVISKDEQSAEAVANEVVDYFSKAFNLPVNKTSGWQNQPISKTVH